MVMNSLGPVSQPTHQGHQNGEKLHFSFYWQFFAPQTLCGLHLTCSKRDEGNNVIFTGCGAIIS